MDKENDKKNIPEMPQYCNYFVENAKRQALRNEKKIKEDEKEKSQSLSSIIGYLIMFASFLFLFVDWHKAIFYFVGGFFISQGDVFDKKKSK